MGCFNVNRIGKKFFDRIEFTLFVLPVLVLVSLAFYIPFGMSMFYSMTEWNGVSKDPIFIGLENFKQIFMGDNSFRDASIFTIKYAVLYIIIVNVIALFLAIILDQKMKSANVLRAIFFLPYILSLVIVGFIWKFIFVQGFNSLDNITGLGVFRISWLGEANLAFISVLFVSIWHSVGFYIVIYIAGLQSVPHDILEAATVDGAGPVKKFFGVMLPMLAPSVTICVFLALTSSIKVFDEIISLTAGGPGGSTISVTLDIYREAFQNNMYGYGTAKALILFVAVLIITVIQLKFFKGKEVEI